MILCFSDDPNVVRATTVETRRLPRRLTTAAGFTGGQIALLDPEIVVVATVLRADDSDRTAVVYRLSVAGENWIPDVRFDHECEAISVDAGRPGSEDEVHFVSPEAASAAAAAIALRGADRVLFVAAGAAAAGELPGLIDLLGPRILAGLRRDRRRRSGDAHVVQAIGRAEELADQLRLTVTQRARLIQTVRSAAVRGGAVPAPLTDADATRAGTKEEAKRRLAMLEDRLRGWKHAGI